MSTWIGFALVCVWALAVAALYEAVGGASGLPFVVAWVGGSLVGGFIARRQAFR